MGSEMCIRDRYNGVMSKKIDDFKSAFDERDYRFRRLEVLIYGLYAWIIFLLIVSGIY